MRWFLVIGTERMALFHTKSSQPVLRQHLDEAGQACLLGVLAEAGIRRLFILYAQAERVSWSLQPGLTRSDRHQWLQAKEHLSGLPYCFRVLEGEGLARVQLAGGEPLVQLRQRLRQTGVMLLAETSLGLIFEGSAGLSPQCLLLSHWRARLHLRVYRRGRLVFARETERNLPNLAEFIKQTRDHLIDLELLSAEQPCSVVSLRPASRRPAQLFQRVEQMSRWSWLRLKLGAYYLLIGVLLLLAGRALAQLSAPYWLDSAQVVASMSQEQESMLPLLSELNQAHKTLKQQQQSRQRLHAWLATKSRYSLPETTLASIIDRVASEHRLVLRRLVFDAQAPLTERLMVEVELSVPLDPAVKTAFKQALSADLSSLRLLDPQQQSSVLRSGSSAQTRARVRYVGQPISRRVQ